jgi:hypothetical protein
MFATEPFNITFIRERLNQSTNEITIDKLIQLYPNPTSNVVYVKTDLTESNFTYTIRDIAGKTILTGESITQQPISISELSKGMYTITIDVAGEQVTKRLIKN